MASAVDLVVSPLARPTPPAARTVPVREGRGTTVRLKAVTKLYPARPGWRNVLRPAGWGARVPAVDGVTFDVAEGELFGVLGRNGAGKTTLFRILSTLVPPDRGTAEVAGLNVSRQAGLVRRVLAMVPAEERSLHWRISARENLRLYAGLFRIPPGESEWRIAELISLLELEADADRMVGRMSTGRRQRLLLARALLPRPRVLLLDEPTRGLDPVSARAFRVFLRDVVAGRDGCTVLLATHDGEEALGLCDRVAVLERGRLLAVDAPGALADRYAGERYRVWTRAPEHPALRALAAGGGTSPREGVLESADGWSTVEIDSHGGPDSSSALLERLVRRGVPIAGFERVRPSLADLIARMLEREVPRA